MDVAPDHRPPTGDPNRGIKTNKLLLSDGQVT